MSDNVNIAAIDQGPFAGGDDYPFVGESALSSAVINAKVIFSPDLVKLPLFLSGSIQPGGVVSLLLQDTEKTVATLNSTTLLQNLPGETPDRRVVYFRDEPVHVWLEIKDGVSAQATTAERLDIRVYYPSLPLVSEIELTDCSGNPVEDPILASEVDSIALVDGNNTEWSADQQTVRVNASPGYGLGKVDNCQSLSSLIYTVAGVPAVNGDLQIYGDECYRVEPETEQNEGSESLSIIPGKIKFYQDCEPCCDCGEFEAVALAAMRQNRITDYVKNQLDNATDSHNKLVKSINQKMTAAADLFIRAGLYVNGYVGVANCRLHLSMTYRNTEATTQEGVTMFVTIEDDYEGRRFYASSIDSVPGFAAIFRGREYIKNAPTNKLNSYSFTVSLGEVRPSEQLTAQIVIPVPRPAVYRACLNLAEPLNRPAPVCHAIDVPCE